LNVTVPVAADGLAVALNVTKAPTVDGFGDELRVVVDAVLATTF
jgi:hypothetical protein